MLLGKRNHEGAWHNATMLLSETAKWRWHTIPKKQAKHAVETRRRVPCSFTWSPNKGPSLLFKCLQADLPDKVGHLPAHLCVCFGHVFEVLAARVQETCTSKARALELTNDMVHF